MKEDGMGDWKLVPTKLNHRQLYQLADAWGYTTEETAGTYALMLEALAAQDGVRDTVQEAQNIIRLIEPLLGPIDCNRETVLLNLYEDIFFILSRHAGSDGEESETCTAIRSAT